MKQNFAPLIVLLLTSPAFADGYSTDIELLQPGFSVDGLPGIDSPAMLDEVNVWHTGILTQYEQDPLVLYDSGYEVGPIVENRVAMHLGMTYAISRNAAVRLVLPTYFNSGTQAPIYEADGGGLGDLSLGIRFQALKAGPFTAAVRADIAAPTGRKDSYMGEESLRTGAALLTQLELGPVDWLVDVGALARSKVETQSNVRECFTS